MKARIMDIEFEIETEEDLELLLRKAGETEIVSDEEIVAIVKPALVTPKRSDRKHPRKFTAEEDEVIRSYEAKEAAEMLNRDLHSIYDRRYRLGFRRKKQKHRRDQTKTSDGFGKKYTIMTEKELQIIKQFPDEAAKILPHRSKSAIYKARRRHGWL